MLLPAIQTCERSWFWRSVLESHTLNLRPRWGQDIPNDSGVSRWQVTAFFLVTMLLNLDIGVIYYLYLFGGSCARMNERIPHDARQSSHVSMLSLSKPFQWVEELHLTSSVVFNLSDIGLPARLPTASNIVSSSTFATSNRYSRDLEWGECYIQYSQAAYFSIFAPRQKTVLFGQMDWRNWTQFVFMMVPLTLEACLFNHLSQNHNVDNEYYLPTLHKRSPIYFPWYLHF